MSSALAQLAFKWRHISGKVDSGPLAVRVGLLIGGSLAVVAAFSFIMLFPKISSYRAIEGDIKNAQTQLKTLQDKVGELRKSSQEAVNKALTQNQAMQEKLNGLNHTLDSILGGLPSDVSMLPMMRSMLEQEAGLKLIYLKKLPNRSLSFASDNPNGAALYYQKGVELSFNGNFLGTVAYLQKVENQPWRVFGDRFEYEVKTYPEAEVKVRLFTLVAATGVGS